MYTYARGPAPKHSYELWRIWRSLHVFVHTHMYICTFTCIFMHIRVCKYIPNTYAQTYEYLCICIYSSEYTYARAPVA